MSLSYAKFWTSMLNDDWFVSLSCNARGLWMQLILIAKQVGDTGVVSLRSYSALAVMCGCDDSSAAKYLRLFAEVGKISVVKTGEKSLTIEIVNYAYYQRGEVVNDLKSGEKSPRVRKVTKGQSGEKSPLNQTRQNRTEQNTVVLPTCVGTTPVVSISSASPAGSFLTYFGHLYQERFKTKYICSFAKDTVLAKGILSAIPPDEVARRLQRFFGDDDDFLRHSGHTVGIFRIRVNQYSDAVWAKKDVSVKNDWVVDPIDKPKSITGGDNG